MASLCPNNPGLVCSGAWLRAHRLGVSCYPTPPDCISNGGNSQFQNRTQLYYDIGKAKSHQEESQVVSQNGRGKKGSINILVIKFPTTVQSLDIFFSHNF